MKRVTLATIALAAMLTATAQDLPLAAGLTYNYSTEYGNHGVGLKLQYRPTEHLRLEPEMIYSNMRKDVTTLHLNLNVHYVMPIIERMDLYPFVGLNYSHWGYNGPNVNRWGANLGAGIDFDISSRVTVLAELRFQAVKQESQAITTLGLKYNF